MTLAHTDLIPTNISSSIKKIEKQRSFSFKKKNQKCKVEFENPSLDQCRKIKDILLGVKTDTIGMKVCVVCYHCIFIHAYVDLQLSHLCTMPISKLKVPIDKVYIAAEADIPDSVIDQTLCQYKEYFTNEAWSLISQISMSYMHKVFVCIYICIYHTLHIVAKKRKRGDVINVLTSQPS